MFEYVRLIHSNRLVTFLSFFIIIKNHVLCEVFENISDLGKVNFLCGISEVAVQSADRSKCVENFNELLEGIAMNKVWALKIIDSFGNMPNSFTWGNNFWFSDAALCSDLNSPFKMSISSAIPRELDAEFLNATSPFPVEFRMIYYNFTTPMQVDVKLQHRPILHVGLCIPSACSQDQITGYADTYFKMHVFKTQIFFKIKLKKAGTKVPGIYWSFFKNTGVILFICLAASGIAIAVSAELIQILRKRKYRLEKAEISAANFTSSWSINEKLLICLSIRENFLIAFDASPKNFLSVIAGIRTVICFWIMLFHVYYHSLFTIKNVPLLFAKLESFIYQPILQSCFYVDVFFVLSAFLLVHNFLLNSKQLETIRSNTFLDNIKLFATYIGHRNLRLMPVFILTILLSDVIFTFLDMFSPFMMNQDSDLYCRETWWQNLLYINNFITPKMMCSSWGWYIACDMQFYILFLFMLFIYAKREILGQAVFLTTLTLFVITSFWCNYSYGITFQGDVIYQTMEFLYIKPYVRINPYFGGALMAWILYKLKGKNISMRKNFITFYWFLCFLVYLVTIYMSFWKSAPIWIVSLIMSIGKLFFGMFIGRIIVMCQLGYGGIFTKLMSSKLFLHLNKFSYCMYMIAPLVITMIFGLRSEATEFAEVSAFSDIVCVMSLTYFSAILAAILVEIPINRISCNFVLKKV